jgi:hypothetical protein
MFAFCTSSTPVLTPDALSVQRVAPGVDERRMGSIGVVAFAVAFVAIVAVLVRRGRLSPGAPPSIAVNGFRNSLSHPRVSADRRSGEASGSGACSAR